MRSHKNVPDFELKARPAVTSHIVHWLPSGMYGCHELELTDGGVCTREPQCTGADRTIGVVENYMEGTLSFRPCGIGIYTESSPSIAMKHTSRLL